MAEELKRVRTQLVEGCSQALIGDLLDDLLCETILSEAEVEDIIQRYPVIRDRCRQMVDTVKKKGDNPCIFLLMKLKERDQALSEKLKIQGAEEEQQTEKLMIPVPEKGQEAKPLATPDTNELIPCSQEEIKRIINTEDSKMYPVKPRGNRKRLALIICNIQFNTMGMRNGAECDITAMRKLLEELGYEVHYYPNLTAKAMLEKMREFASRNEHSDSDSTFIVLMSHGERDVICGTDSERIRNEDGKEEATNILRIDDIFNTFNNKNCSKLRGKPKVILIQACRGKDNGRVLASDSTQTDKNEDLESDCLKLVQKETDFICFCSTTPDTFSYRDPKKGSLFILSLIENLKKHAHCLSLEDIFREVKSSFVDKIQMPTSERNTLTKKFYLLPGY